MDTNQKVKKILSDFPETRNSKEKLVMKYWNVYYWVWISQDQAKKILQSEKINSIIREWTHIQNTEWLFMPDAETRKNRSHQQKVYQTRFSPNKTRNWSYNYS